MWKSCLQRHSAEEKQKIEKVTNRQNTVEGLQQNFL